MPRGGQRKESGLSPEQDAIIEKAVKRAKKAVTPSHNIDESYFGEYKRFMKWVLKNNRQPNPSQYPLRFITRETVDAYYLNAVPWREFGSQNSLKKIRHALQKMWDEVESRALGEEEDEGAPPPLLFEGESKVFSIQSDSTKEGERKQQRYYSTIAKVKNGGKDPFGGLKLDLLTNEEKKILVKYIIVKRPDWKDLGCSFYLGCNAGVRGKSTRSLCLKDITVSHGFAPKQGRSLTIILRKDVQKVSYQVDRLVGLLRHKEYLLCGVLSTAMNVVSLLRELGEKIHFTRSPDKKKDAEWWHYDFVEFENLGDEQNAMTEVFKKTGVQTHKVTHHRSHCVMYASTEGLQQYQVSTLTKHEKASLDKSYWAEMERKTLTVMAGFEMGESYFVPRTEIGLPFPIDECLTKIFGYHYGRWKGQQASRSGDKSECGVRFFTRLLPFFVEVLVQDGIYLIQDFPEHEMSLLLRNKLGGQYVAWAREKRAEVKEKLETFEPDRIAALNEATQRAFQALEAQNHRLVDAVCRESARNIELSQQVQLLGNQLKQSEESMKKVFKAALAEHATRMQAMLEKIQEKQRPEVPLDNVERATNTVHQANTSVAQILQRPLGIVGGQPEANLRQEDAAPPQRQQAPPQQQRPHRPQQPIHHLLQSVAYQPDMPGEFPKTWAHVLHRWESRKLSEFVGHSRAAWSRNNKSRFNKMYGAFRCIQRAAHLRGITDLKAAAKNLDNEMGKVPMTTFLERKVKEHPDIKSRNKKRKTPAQPTARTTATVPRAQKRRKAGQHQTATSAQQQSLTALWPQARQPPPGTAALPPHLQGMTIHQQIQRGYEEDELDAVAQRAAARKRSQTQGTERFLQSRQARPAAVDGNKKPAARPMPIADCPKLPFGTRGSEVFQSYHRQQRDKAIAQRTAEDRRKQHYSVSDYLENADAIGERNNQIAMEENQRMIERQGRALHIQRLIDTFGNKQLGYKPRPPGPARRGRCACVGCPFDNQELEGGGSHRCSNCGIPVHNLCTQRLNTILEVDWSMKVQHFCGDACKTTWVKDNAPKKKASSGSESESE